MSKYCMLAKSMVRITKNAGKTIGFGGKIISGQDFFVNCGPPERRLELKHRSQVKILNVEL